MSVVALRAEAVSGQAALAAIEQSDVALRIATLMERSIYSRWFSVVPSLELLYEKACRTDTRVILLDGSLLGKARLAETFAALPAGVSVILLAGPERQSEAAPRIAQGNVDFVAKTGDFEFPAVAFLERRLRASARAAELFPSSKVKSADELSAILRHEINNPLTGILGNAELLLGHCDRLPAAETQRLQTIVELSVRLRENIRRLSVEWEANVQSARSS